MVNLNPTDGYAVLINTFQVAPERAEELLAILHEAAATMRTMPGFVSANLHLSEDSSRIVNYVQWANKAYFESMLQDQKTQPHMKAAADIAKSYDPVIYSLRLSDEL
jgi:quinol monooxygenase YgiN